MAITILDSPNTFGLLDGRQFFKLSTNNQFTNPGTAHVFDIVFSSLPVNNLDMAFAWNSGADVLAFIFKTSPDDSGLQLPLGVVSIQLFVDMVLIPALERNATLYSNFSIASITNGVRLTARKTGVLYNTSTVIFGSGIIRATVASGVDAVERENFSIRGLVDVLANGVSSQHLLTAYTYNNDIYIHLNKLLIGFYNRLARPSFALAACADVSAAVVKYRARFAEMFGALPVVQQLGTSAYKYALPGGAGKNFKELGDVQSYITNKYFLTALRSKTVLPNCKEVLNYWHSSGLGDFTVNVTATKIDGTNVSAVLATKTGVLQYSLWVIDASLSSIASALSLAPLDIASYNIRVVDTSGPGSYFTELYPFKVDKNTPKDVTQLLYQNGLGVYEFCTLKGEATKKTAVKTDTVALLQDNPGKEDPANYTLSQEVQDVWIVATGFLTRTEIEHIKEVMRSRDVYLVTETFYQPILVTDANAALFDTDSGTLNGATVSFTTELKEAYL